MNKIKELETLLDKLEDKLKSPNLNMFSRKKTEEDCSYLQKEIQDRIKQKQIAATY